MPGSTTVSSRRRTRSGARSRSQRGSRRSVESATGSSPSPELAAALHRLRSTLARLKAELELAQESEGPESLPGRMLGDLNEALMLLQEVEQAAFGVVPVLVVDDDVRLAELTARGLRRLGYDADATSSLRDLRAQEIVVFALGFGARACPAPTPRPQGGAPHRGHWSPRPRVTGHGRQPRRERLPGEAG